MQDCRIADCAVRTCIPVGCDSALPHCLLRTPYSGSAIGYLAGFWALRDGCPPGRGVENAGLQDCGLRSADLFSCCGLIPPSALPTPHCLLGQRDRVSCGLLGAS